MTKEEMKEMFTDWVARTFTEMHHVETRVLADMAFDQAYAIIKEAEKIEKKGQIRVFRIYEFTGPREIVEEQIKCSIHGERCFGIANKQTTIKAVTIGEFPEIMEVSEESDES